jgi:hypothetical protein
VGRISERGAEEVESDVIGLEWEREVERRRSLVLAAAGRFCLLAMMCVDFFHLPPLG